MKRRWMPVLAGAWLVAGSAAAQGLDLHAPLLAEAAVHARLSAGWDDDTTLAFAAGELRQERVIKGAPYCAEAVHESVQLLPDAAGGVPNRIVHRQTSRLCRDGEGRTRQEVQRDGRTRVYLHDPVAGEAWLLDPQRQSVRRLASAGAAPHGPDAQAWRDYGERMRRWAAELARSMRSQLGGPTPPTPPVPPAPPAPAAGPAVGPGHVAPVVIQRADAVGGGQPREVEVHVLRAGDGAGAPLPPPPVAWRAQQLAPRGPAVVTLLPAREIEGVSARGERSTWTIEAGRIGNERPIEIVREVWTSPDLGVTLASRDFDPRSGEVNYRLQQLRRGEPDAALMRVPPEYSPPRRAPEPRPPVPSRG